MERAPVVVNQKHADYTVYIGRSGKGQSSIWGNPVKVNGVCPVCGETHGNRGSTLPCFERYLRARLQQEPALREALRGLSGQVLGCFCKPAPCHGDIIVKLWREVAVADTADAAVPFVPILTPAQAADSALITALRRFETRLRAAPQWLGAFSMTVENTQSTLTVTRPLLGLGAWMAEQAYGQGWSLPDVSLPFRGYTHLYLQQYGVGDSVHSHRDPQSNHHSALLLGLGNFDSPTHLIDGKSYIFPPGVLFQIPAWLKTWAGLQKSPVHSVSSLSRGERWAVILTKQT